MILHAVAYCSAAVGASFLAGVGLAIFACWLDERSMLRIVRSLYRKEKP
jgi:hypothetical protein